MTMFDDAPHGDRPARTYEVAVAAHARTALAGLATPLAIELLARTTIADPVRRWPWMPDVIPASARQGAHATAGAGT